MMARKVSRRERRFTTYRLLPNDYELLRHLGYGKPGFKDRHQALLNLVPVVSSMKMPSKTYRSIRIGIPAELDAAIREVALKTNRDFVDILLTAARIYQHEENGDRSIPVTVGLPILENTNS